MRIVGSVLQLVGLALAVIAGWLIIPWLGILAAAGATFAVGYKLEANHLPGSG